KVSMSISAIDDSKTEIIFDVISNFYNPDTEEELIEHIGRTKYIVTNLHVSAEKDSVDIPDELMVTLYSLAHTHARALLASDVQNTIYKDKAFLPVVNPKEILKKTGTAPGQHTD